MIEFTIPFEAESGGNLFLKLTPKHLRISGQAISLTTLRRVRIFILTRVVLFMRGVYPKPFALLILTIRGRNPKTFQEKLAHRLTFGRTKVLSIFGDKLEVKKFIESRIGSDYLPRIYSVWEPGQKVDWDAIPRQFVAKCTHGIGASMIVRDGAPESKLPLPKKGDDWRIVHSTPEGFDKNVAVSFFAKWTKQNFSKKIDEFPQWFYGKGKPRVIIEELLVTSEGAIPTDYKFYCFDGKCHLVFTERNRFTRLMVDLFTREGEPIEGRLAYLPNSAEKWQLPENLDEMVRIAETLAEGFDFVSVDLYWIDSRIVVGEVAIVAALASLFSPPELETWLGSLWKLPSRRAKKK